MLVNKRQRLIITVLAIVLLSGLMSMETMAASNTEEVDRLKPIINYAYIDEGVLKINLYDNEKLADEPIIYTIDNEIRSYKIDIDDYEYERNGNRRDRDYKIYEIKVEIPSTISIRVIDAAGNENTYSFNIKEDNVTLTKNIPEYVLERLAENRQSEVNQFKGYEGIFELEYGKIVNAFSLYEEVVEDNYRSYDKNDIRIRVSGLSIDRDRNIKLNKYGIFKVTITHNKDKTFEETAYILIKPDWRNEDDRRTPSNASPYIVYKDRVKVSDFFRYDDESNGRKSKIDSSYMMVYNERTDELVKMEDQISLELNVPYKLKVLNFENNSEQDFHIMRQEKSRSSTRNFTDLPKEHWASRDINSLVSRGLIAGYPNDTFNPNGNITVREFMTILSRYIAEKPDKGKSIVGNVMVQINPTSWGYIESKSILDRMSLAELMRFDYFSLDRPISREEVAFLIDKSLKLDTPYTNNLRRPLNDVGSSSYPGEISKLVDLEVVSGYPDGSFRPKNNIMRSEIAALFAKLN